MNSVHIRTEDLTCDERAARVEMSVAQLPGVVAVTSVRALHLTSVLFDETRVGRAQIAEAITCSLKRPTRTAVTIGRTSNGCC